MEIEEDLFARTYRDSHLAIKPALEPSAAKERNNIREVKSNACQYQY